MRSTLAYRHEIVAISRDFYIRYGWTERVIPGIFLYYTGHTHTVLSFFLAVKRDHARPSALTGDPRDCDSAREISRVR